MPYIKLAKTIWNQPFVALWDVTECVSLWFNSRNWNRILLGFLPFVIPVTVLAVLIVLGKKGSKPELAKDYLAVVSTTRETPIDNNAGGQAFSKMLYRRAYQLDPNNPAARYNIATRLVDAGELGQARKVMKGMNPDDEQKIRRQISSWWIARFKQDFVADSWETALRSLQEAMDIDPLNRQVGAEIVRMGLSNQRTEIRSDLREEVSLASKRERNSAALVMLGHLSAREGNFDEAISFLESARESSPGSAFILSNLAMALTRNSSKDDPRALNQIKTAIKFDSNDPELYRKQGRILVWMENHKEAIVSYRKSLELDPSQSTARKELIDTYRVLGKLEEAEAEQKKLDLPAE